MIIKIVLCLTLVLTMINTIRIMKLENIIATAIILAKEKKSKEKLAKENIEKEKRE